MIAGPTFAKAFATQFKAAVSSLPASLKAAVNLTALRASASTIATVTRTGTSYETKLEMEVPSDQACPPFSPPPA